MATFSRSLTLKAKESKKLLACLFACLLSFALIPTTAFALPQNSNNERLSGKQAVEQGLQQSTVIPHLLSNTTDQTTSIGFNEGISTLASDNLPSKFDLRHVDTDGDGISENYVSSVKLQDPWGTCWAFGATAAIETTVAYDTKIPSDIVDPDFSERHLSYFTYTALPEDSATGQGGEGVHSLSNAPNYQFTGGTPAYVASLVSSGIGPIPESEAPYQGKDGIVANSFGNRILDDSTVIDSEGNVVDQPANPVSYWSGDDWSLPEESRFGASFELQHSQMLPDTVVKTLNEDKTVSSVSYNEEAINAVKSELVNGHAVSVAFYADASLPGQEETSKYINLDTWAHYTYDESVMPNHAVCIIGYDDNYSKDNFLHDHQPPADGAWIVKNSWGAEDNEFPNKNNWGVDGSGYFHISYYDKSITQFETFEYDTEKTMSDNEEYIIGQYDFMPATETPDVASETPIFMSNVFTAPENMTVHSLSTQTATANTTVTYDLYRLNPDYTNPTDGTLLTSVTESYPYAGYHRIELDRSYVFAGGDPLSVVVTTQRADGSYEISYDKNISELSAKLSTLLMGFPPGVINYAKGVINAGESFVGEADEQGDPSWADWGVLCDEQQQKSRNDLAAFGIIDAINNGDADFFRNNSTIDMSKVNQTALFSMDNFPIKFYGELLANELPFTDLGLSAGETPHWAVLSGTIGEIYNRNLMSGYSDDSGNPSSIFGPDDQVTRAQTAATLFRYANPLASEEEIIALAGSDTKFADLASDQWYSAPMKWAEQQDIFRGTIRGDEGATYVRPDDPITREEIAAVLHRYCISVGGDTSENPTLSYLNAPDSAEVSDWASDSMEWAFDHNLINGYGGSGELGAHNPTTRAEYAKMLLSAIDTFETTIS